MEGGWLAWRARRELEGVQVVCTMRMGFIVGVRALEGRVTHCEGRDCSFMRFILSARYLSVYSLADSFALTSPPPTIS